MEMRVCFIGDSFTHGVGDAEALGWRGRLIRRMLKRNPDITAYDLGVRHETSSDVLVRWQAEAKVRLMPGTEHRLAFCFGSNDCADNGHGKPRVDLVTSVGNARQILVQAKEMAPTILIGPPPVCGVPEIDQRVQVLERRLREVAQSYEIPFLPMFDYLKNCEVWRKAAAAGDGTHPDGAGYSLMADQIWNWPQFHVWLSTEV